MRPTGDDTRVLLHYIKTSLQQNKVPFLFTSLFFLSDPSPIIALATLVTHSLTNSCLVNLIDVTLACQDANSKLVEVVTVADLDAEKRVDDSLVQIRKLKICIKTNFLFRP